MQLDQTIVRSSQIQQDTSCFSRPRPSAEVFTPIILLIISLKKDGNVNTSAGMQRDLRLLQMNVNIKFNLPAIIPSSVSQKLKNHLPIALSKQSSVCERSGTLKLTFLCVIQHFVREDDAETIQPTGKHSFI